MVVMRSLSFLVLLVGAALSKPTKKSDTHIKSVDLRMPGVQPKVPDTYLCYPAKMSKDAVYLTGFVPHANMSTAHHVLLYGCKEPGKRKEVWNCGEMASPDNSFDNEPVCKEGSKIVYAWAMDAPPLTLPKDVSFKVGGDSGINWLVLQVHYKDVHNFLPPKNMKDNSGLTLHTTDEPTKKEAGIYLMMTGGTIPPHSTVYMETACSYNEPVEIHPFAYRVHAHTHGQVVSGYRVRGKEWTEIGRMSPQKPQMFYNVTNPGMDVKNNDILAARCTMVNNEDRQIDIGATQKDEMCNFYIMYWVNGNNLPRNEMCFTDGPPQWYWKDFKGLSLEGAPDSVSLVPGAKEALKETEKLVEESNDDMRNDIASLLGEFGERQADVPSPMDDEFGLMDRYPGNDLEAPQQLYDLDPNDLPLEDLEQLGYD